MSYKPPLSVTKRISIGLIHRDIKPSNVILCQRGGLNDVVKLLDFGLVKASDSAGDVDQATEDGAIVGTPAYMSPEQTAGQRDLSAASDIYSLGAMAYALLAGRPPFSSGTPMQILSAHMYAEAVPLRQVDPAMPEDLEAVVERCLRKDRFARYATAKSLDQDLAGCDCANQWTQEDADSWWSSANVMN